MSNKIMFFPQKISMGEIAANLVTIKTFLLKIPHDVIFTTTFLKVFFLFTRTLQNYVIGILILDRLDGDWISGDFSNILIFYFIY